MDLRLVTQRDYNVGTWLGIVNACSLLTSFGWTLVAKRSFRYSCYLAFLCTSHLAVVAPIMYVSSVYVDSVVYDFSSNTHALLSNFLFVTTGMLLLGKDAVTCREKAASTCLLYVFVTLIACATTFSSDETGSTADASDASILMWIEPIVNSLCILWFVLASVYRYSCLCMADGQYMVCSRAASVGLQVMITLVVFAERAAMYVVVNQNGDIIWWRLAHWGRTAVCQAVTYGLANRNRHSQITFNP